ncbi:hypothetical protein Y032_0293g1611 [Ancylostoma ceylanicum]|nr:hypothetical protein Y032_0293g1611 [Ancylostoma ceylanicum]
MAANDMNSSARGAVARRAYQGREWVTAIDAHCRGPRAPVTPLTSLHYTMDSTSEFDGHSEKKLEKSELYEISIAKKTVELDVHFQKQEEVEMVGQP